MKKLLCVPLIFAAGAACAQPALLGNWNDSNLYAHGIYLGAQIGRTDLHNANAFTQTIGGAIADSMLFGIERIGLGAYVGYRYNDYFGAEVNYHQLANMDETGGVNDARNHTRVFSADLLAKGSLPLSKYFSPFAKAGISYVYQDILSTWDAGDTLRYKSKTGRVMPAIAIGADVHFTKSWAIDASWTHWFKNGPIKDIDFPAIGVSYTFDSQA